VSGEESPKEEPQTVENSKKEPQLEIREINEIKSQSWAGIIAVMAWAGFLSIVGILAFFNKLEALKEVITAMGTLMGVITTFYFTRDKVQ